MKYLHYFILFALNLNINLAFAIEKEGRPHGQMPEKHFSVLDKYCLNCHDADTEKGKVNLEDLDFSMKTVQAAELWQKVLNSMNSGEMPPEDKKQLNDREKTSFLSDLSEQLVVAREDLSDSGGVITMRRLNRREYKNSIESILGISVDVNDLPDDTISGSFDTSGSSLFFSSDQFEQYLTIAKHALGRAMFFGKKPKFRKQRFEAEELVVDWIYSRLKINPKLFKQSKALVSIQKGKLNPSFENVSIAAKAQNLRVLNHQAFFNHPESKKGAPLYNYFGNMGLPKIELPKDGVHYTFTVRAKVALLNDQVPEHRRYLEYGFAGSSSVALDLRGFQKINGSMENPQIIEFKVTPQNKSELSLVLRERHHNSSNASKTLFRNYVSKHREGPAPSLWIDWVEWEGPHIEQWPPRSHSKIFIPKKSNQSMENYHRSVIENFYKRANRNKTPTKKFIDRLMHLYRNDIESGLAEKEALKEQLALILSTPGFLYLNEPTHGEKKRVLNDTELAIRLSYFLWSSPPDQELMNLARENKLNKSKVLRAQTNRLMKDPRFNEFVQGFSYQWLHMERLDFFQFDFEKYPLFDDSLKASSRSEIYETVKDAILNKRPISELLNSNYVVINNILADHYGIPGVEGESFRRVLVPPKVPRGGFLSMAAVMAMGSDGKQTSPVDRGVWVLKHLLNNPPPPAPPNVPQLNRFEGKLLPAHALQKIHQEEPQCAQCHRKIDPIGFALQNFNAIGLWRDKEVIMGAKRTLDSEKSRENKRWRREKMISKSYPIDPSGSLPDGTKFSNFNELRECLVDKSDDFAHGFTENLIAYALGRPYGFSDAKLAQKVVSHAKKKSYAMDEFIHAIIQSDQFKQK